MHLACSGVNVDAQPFKVPCEQRKNIELSRACERRVRSNSSAGRKFVCCRVNIASVYVKEHKFIFGDFFATVYVRHLLAELHAHAWPHT